MLILKCKRTSRKLQVNLGGEKKNPCVPQDHPKVARNQTLDSKGLLQSHCRSPKQKISKQNPSPESVRVIDKKSKHRLSSIFM